MSIWKDLIGSVNNAFQIGLGVGQKCLKFGDRGSLNWNPKAARKIDLPDSDGLIPLTLDIDKAIALSGSIPWTQFVYLNGWGKWTGAAGFATPSYRKHPGGLVELKGILAKSSGQASFLQAIALLPPSCRPSESLMFVAMASALGNEAPATIFVLSSGNVAFRTGTMEFLSLPTATFAVDKATAVFLGDSNTYAIFLGSTVTAIQRFSYLLSQSLGITEDNQGICASLFQNTNAATQPFPTTQLVNGFDSYGIRVISEYPDYLFFMYGLNDLRWNGNSLTNFTNQLDSFTADLIRKRICPTRIYLGNIPYIRPDAYSPGAPWTGANNALHLQYNAVIQEVARKYQCRFADIYTQMLNNGGDTLLQSDGIHMNASGHVQIQTAFLNAIIPI
jgi:lysophospholipase L1-like esterase